MGRSYLKFKDWTVEDEKGKPAFSFIPKKHRPFSKLLFLILLLSFLLNLYGIWWGLPDNRGWATDEIKPSRVQKAIRWKFSHGWHDKYPPFHYYVLAMSHIPFLLLDQMNLIDIRSFPVYTILFFVGRFISVLMGTSTVFIVYLCGREIYEEKAALFAALISAMIAPFLYYSKIINVDVPYIFWFVLSLLFYIRLLKYHRIADYLLFSATAVISICTKDQAYGLYILTPLAIVLSHYLARKKHSTSARLVDSIVNRKTILSLLLAVILFFGVHNVFFNLDGFMRHIRLITGPASQSFRLYETTITGHFQMLWQSLKHLRFSFGWLMFLTCILGLIIAFLRRSNALLFEILIPGISYYLFFISVILYNYVRFFIPICIILAFFGGKVLSDFLNPSQKYYKARIILVSIIFGYTFLYSLSINIMMAKDSRYYIEAWVHQHIDENAKIGLVGHHRYLFPRVRGSLIKPGLSALEGDKPDYLIINADHSRFVPDNEKEFFSRLHSGKLGYQAVLQYRTQSRWLLLDHEHIVKNNRKIIFSNIEHINPEIKILRHESVQGL